MKMDALWRYAEICRVKNGMRATSHPWLRDKNNEDCWSAPVVFLKPYCDVGLALTFSSITRQRSSKAANGSASSRNRPSSIMC